MEHAKHLIVIGPGDHGRGTIEILLEASGLKGGPGEVVNRNVAAGQHVFGNPARLVPPPARRSRAS